MLVVPIKALTDNYIWAICVDQKVTVVDPGSAAEVIDFCEKNHYELDSILITHHHLDHVGGVAQLFERYKCDVYAPLGLFPTIALSVKDGDMINLESMGLAFHVMGTPGHTLDHIVFYNSRCLFSGDTLFSLGCGRLFEGSYKQLYDSLQKLAKLDDSILVYPAHEYTFQNNRFCLAVDRDNSMLQSHLKWCQKQSLGGVETLPTTIGFEKLHNVFLRCGELDIINAAQSYSSANLSNELDVFKVLRMWKDGF